MTINIELLQDRDAAVWDEFVAKHQDCTPFHSTRWKRVVETVYGHQGYYLFAQRDAVQGILPLFLIGSRITGRMLVSLPYAGTQPACCAIEPEAEIELRNAALALAEETGAKTVELREVEQKPWDWSASSTYVNVRLPLARGADEVWQTRLESRVRTKIRAAKKRGLRVAWGGRDFLGSFFGLYAETMHRLGSPPHSKLFFQTILDVFSDQARILVILDGDEPAAAAFVMQDNRWIGFPWASSSMRMRTKHPNNLLYWSLIEKACGEGYDTLDMGRSPIGSGTLHFKKQWGGVVRPLWYHFHSTGGEPLVSLDASDPVMKLASHMWRRLPIRMANRLGPSLARLIP